MVDLAPGSQVSVENPNLNIDTSMPGKVNNIWLKEGPVGPPGPPGTAGGDVVGPASAVADRIAVYNGTTGKLIKDGGVTVAQLQPLDADLTAIAALTTTAYGRALLALANQAALMGLLSASSETAQGIVEIATQTETNTGTDDARAVTPLKLQTRLAAYAQPLDSDLTAIAALTTTSYGRAFLALADAAAARTALALGGAAILNVGTAASTVAAGDDSRITGAAQKSSNLSDLPSASTARTNLGLGTAAVANTGTASGNVPVLNGSGRLDVARLGSGTPNGSQVLHDNGTFAVVPGTVLDYAKWDNGGVTTQVNLIGNAATLVTIDPALQVSFTARTSQVGVTMCATYWPDQAASGSGAWWGLLASGTPVAGSMAEMGSANTSIARTTHYCVITGLTPGTTYTWDWAWAGNEDGASTLLVGSGIPALGDAGGPMTIKVEAL